MADPVFVSGRPLRQVTRPRQSKRFFLLIQAAADYDLVKASREGRCRGLPLGLFWDFSNATFSAIFSSAESAISLDLLDTIGKRAGAACLEAARSFGARRATGTTFISVRSPSFPAGNIPSARGIPLSAQPTARGCDSHTGLRNVKIAPSHYSPSAKPFRAKYLSLSLTVPCRNVLVWSRRISEMRALRLSAPFRREVTSNQLSPDQFPSFFDLCRSHSSPGRT